MYHKHSAKTRKTVAPDPIPAYMMNGRPACWEARKTGALETCECGAWRRINRGNDMEERSDWQEPTVECAYCGHDTQSADPADVNDDAGWRAIAMEHAADCEWVTTRAHRLDP